MDGSELDQVKVGTQHRLRRNEVVWSDEAIGSIGVQPDLQAPPEARVAVGMHPIWHDSDDI